MIGGKSKGEGWTTADDEPVLRVIEWAKQYYPIDPRRVFLFGGSNGAAYVGRFGPEHQDQIAGVIAYCGGYRFDPKLFDAKDPAATKTEWYFVHGGNDNPQKSRRACDFLKERGYRYVFRQMDGYGHTDIWTGNGHPDRRDAEEVREDWLQWAAALRHKELPLSEAQQRELNRVREIVEGDGSIAAPFAGPAMRIGGPQTGDAILPAFRSNKPAFVIQAAGTCERVDCGAKAREALAAALLAEGASRPVGGRKSAGSIPAAAARPVRSRKPSGRMRSLS
ncbi:MAG: hypothetical protein WD066_15585 [Planctomycetaceae bacterium]